MDGAPLVAGSRISTSSRGPLPGSPREPLQNFTLRSTSPSSNPDRAVSWLSRRKFWRDRHPGPTLLQFVKRQRERVKCHAYVTAVTRNNAGDEGGACIDTSVPVNVAAATAENQGALNPSVIASASVPSGSGCPAGTDAFIELKAAPSTRFDTGFYVTFN